MARNDNAKPVQVVMGADENDAVWELAKAAGFKSVSAYIRNLIENDARYRHVELKFDVREMGYRPRKSA